MANRPSEEILEKVKRVKEAVESGQKTVTQASEDEGIHYTTYYNHKNKFGGTNSKQPVAPAKKVAKKVAKKGVKKVAKKGVAAPDPKFHQIALANIGTKTVIIVTEDAEMVSSIINKVMG